MGSMQKGEDDILTLQLRGTGPMKGIAVTADSKARVKGYPIVSDVIIPANSKGKLGTLANKAFGNSCYDKDLSRYPGIDYQIYSLTESIEKTELS